MSVSSIIAIHCQADGCSARFVGAAGQPAYKVRQLARQSGWRFARERFDYCSDHGFHRPPRTDSAVDVPVTAAETRLYDRLSRYDRTQVDLLDCSFCGAAAGRMCRQPTTSSRQPVQPHAVRREALAVLRMVARSIPACNFMPNARIHSGVDIDRAYALLGLMS